jgi:hypothetical protein
VLDFGAIAVKPINYWTEIGFPHVDGQNWFMFLNPRFQALCAIGYCRYVCKTINIDRLNNFEKEIESGLKPSTWGNSPYSHMYISANYEEMCLSYAICGFYQNSFKCGARVLNKMPVFNEYQRQNDFLFPLFKEVPWKLSWRTSNAVGIVQSMYAANDYSTAPILKDALMDAGCEEEETLSVLDSHFLCRGCWLLEQLL